VEKFGHKKSGFGTQRGGMVTFLVQILPCIGAMARELTVNVKNRQIIDGNQAKITN
jgi:hypothetical protein